MAMAELLRSARNVFIRNLLWGGKQPIKMMQCFQDSRNEGLVLCKAHSRIEVQPPLAQKPHKVLVEGIDRHKYEAEPVLQGIHDSRFGKNTGHFALSDPLHTISTAGSLNAIRVGTLPVRRREGEVLHDAPNTYAYVDKSALKVRLLQEKTGASDVFRDWPLKFTMHSGYTFWSVPSEVDEKKTFMFEVRPRVRFWNPHDTCQEIVVLDRPEYIRVAMEKGLSQEEAESAADGIRFKVAVELDFSALGLANGLFFLPPEDAKNPSKVVEEMSNPRLREVPKLDMSRMRLVPHPHLEHCCSCKCFSEDFDLVLSALGPPASSERCKTLRAVGLLILSLIQVNLQAPLSSIPRFMLWFASRTHTPAIGLPCARLQ